MRQTFLALDIDRYVIRMIEIERNSQKRLTVKRAVEKRLPDTGKQEDNAQSWFESVSGAIRELFQKDRIGISHVVICLPGTDAMIKYVTVPPAGRERLDRIMKYEIQLQTPFPIEDVYQDYQFPDVSYVEEKQVLLAVARKEAVDDYLKLFDGMGIKVGMVGVSSLAGFNAVSLCPGQESEQVNLLVNFRQASIDLCIQQGMYLHLARSVPFVLPESAISESALEGCLSQINQTIAYYHSKSKSETSAVSKIILSGPETLLLHFKKFLADKLNLIVETAAPFKALDTRMDRQDGSNFTVAVGLALQALGLVPVKINLLSSRQAQIKAEKERKRYYLGIFLLSLLLPLIYNLNSINRLSVQEDVFMGLQSKLEEYTGVIPDIQWIDAMEKENQALITNLSELKAQVGYSHSFLEILSTFSKFIPDDIWLTYLSRNVSGSISINGRALGYESIEEFISNLENSGMFKQVKLITAKQAEPGRTANTNRYVDFSIELK